MTKKKINIGELEMAIKISFTGDKKIFDMYDKNVKVENVEEIAIDVIRKIKEYENAEYFGVYENGKIIGYFVCEPLKLLSFALEPSFRTRSYLKDFFSIIRKTVHNEFVCLLWSRNIRAVKWLCKNGMKIYETNPQITTLVYTK